MNWEKYRFFELSGNLAVMGKTRQELLAKQAQARMDYINPFGTEKYLTDGDFGISGIFWDKVELPKGWKRNAKKYKEYIFPDLRNKAGKEAKAKLQELGKSFQDEILTAANCHGVSDVDFDEAIGAFCFLQPQHFMIGDVHYIKVPKGYKKFTPVDEMREIPDWEMMKIYNESKDVEETEEALSE